MKVTGKATLTILLSYKCWNLHLRVWLSQFYQATRKEKNCSPSQLGGPLTISSRTASKYFCKVPFAFTNVRQQKNLFDEFLPKNDLAYAKVKGHKAKFTKQLICCSKYRWIFFCWKFLERKGTKIHRAVWKLKIVLLIFYVKSISVNWRHKQLQFLTIPQDFKFSNRS